MSASSVPSIVRPTGRVIACARDANAREHLLLAVRRNGYEAVGVDSFEALKTALLAEQYAAAIIDEPQSVEAIEQLETAVRRADKATQFIILPSLGQRIAAPRSLACEVLEPPMTPDRIGRALFSAVGRAQLMLENIQLRERLEGRMFDGLVGVSPATRDLRSRIQAAAEHEKPVLVHGESGSGKSEVARAVHVTRCGPGKPLISLKCSLLTAAAIDRELHGDEGAAGRLTSAAGGTLVFEDIESLSAPQQAEIAEIFSTGGFRHNGMMHAVETRLIATTTADLQALAIAGKFDHRLLRLLAGTVIEVRALRTRMEDIPVLAEHFMQQAAVREGKPAKQLTPEAMDRLKAHAWPGNARELENVISRCCGLTTGASISAENLSPWLETPPEAGEEPGLTLREMERKLIEATFNRYGGNRELTAKALEIGIRTLSGKLREYGYPPRGGPGSNRESKVA